MPQVLDGTSDASRPQPMRRLGRFEIVRELGRGGGGIVFLARDPVLGRNVALKVPLPDFLLVADQRRRFLLEAQAAAQLDHPHIVPIYEAGHIGPIWYITSAVCKGPTLADWLKNQTQPVHPRTAAHLVAILADAVDHAHRHGFLHRDLKPGDGCIWVGGHPFRAADGPSAISGIE